MSNKQYAGLGTSFAHSFVDSYLQGAQMIREDFYREQALKQRGEETANLERHRANVLKLGQDRLELSASEAGIKAGEKQKKEDERQKEKDQKVREEIKGDAYGAYKLPEGMREQLDMARKHGWSYMQTFPNAKEFTEAQRKETTDAYGIYVGKDVEGYNLDTPWAVQTEEMDSLQGTLNEIKELNEGMYAMGEGAESPLRGLGSQELQQGYETIVDQANKALEGARSDIDPRSKQAWASAQDKADYTDAVVADIRSQMSALAGIKDVIQAEYNELKTKTEARRDEEAQARKEKLFGPEKDRGSIGYQAETTKERAGELFPESTTGKFQEGQEEKRRQVELEKERTKKELVGQRAPWGIPITQDEGRFQKQRRLFGVHF